MSFVLYLVVSVLARRGNHAEAESMVRDAKDLIMQTEEPDVQGHVCMDLAQVLHLQGRRSDERALLQEALALYELKGNQVGAAKARSRLEEPVTQGATS